MKSERPRVKDRRREPSEGVSLWVRNIGGIAESEIELEPGVNVLIGRNATNRTSHLQALMAALGSDEVSLRSGTDRAEVELVMDDERYRREFIRREGRVESSGDPPANAPEIADLFAFLVNDNEARRAVTRGDDLRELIMRPVDTAEIEREIEEMMARRSEVESELEELDELRRRLPALQKEYEGYRRSIETERENRESAREAIEDADADLEASKDEQAELERTLDDLQDRRATLEDARYRIRTEEESIESLRAERADLKAELESLSTSVQEINELGSEIDTLQERKENLDSTIDRMRNVVQFNREMLDDGTGLHDVLEDSVDVDGNELPTGRLLPERQQGIVCWTCGSTVTRDEVSSMLSELQAISDDVLEMRRSVKSDLDDLRQEKKEIEATQNRRDQIESKLERIEGEISDRTETLADLEAKRETLTEEIESLEADVEDVRDPEYDRVLDLHKRANEIEFEIERLREAREETNAAIEDIESRLDSYDDLEAERSELNDRLTELRTTIDRVEASAVDRFNGHMDEILELLGYENIERVWIERTAAEASNGPSSDSRNAFDLHITRRNESGAVHDDTIDHLSESEREVTGIVFALSGYLVHEVYEDVPFMVLDSLEAVDAERIATLVEYFEAFAGSIVLALLPEDATALPDGYNEIVDTA